MTSAAVHIRRAEPRDDEAVGELLVRAYVEQYARILPDVVVSEQRRASLRAVAERRSLAHIWVAEMDGVLVGTVALWPVGGEGSEAWIPTACDLRHLAVDGSARGMGVSGMLLDAAEAEAWKSGATHVCLHVRREAEGVARTYMRRGYVRQPAGDLDFLPDVFLHAYVLAGANAH